MEKREFEIGEVFDVGLIKLKCVEVDIKNENPCEGCVFTKKFHVCGIINDMIGPCASVNREDKKNVVFIEQN